MRRIVTQPALALCTVVVATSQLNAQITQSVQPPAGFPAVGAPATITVTSTGAEPRRALRYAVALGHREHITMEFLMGIAMTVGDTSVPEMKAPMLRMDADVEVRGVSPTGDMTISTTFTDGSWIASPDSDASMLARLNSLSADLKGLSGTAVVSNRGVTREVKFDTRRISNPQLSQTITALQQVMQNVSQPLPEEAVGVGATWEVRSSVNANGVQMFSTVSLQLTAMDETSYTLKVALEQTAPPQAVSSPATGGATVLVDTAANSGSGTTKIQFDMLSPQSEMTLNSKTTMRIDMSGNLQRMDLAISMKLAVTPGVGKPKQDQARQRSLAPVRTTRGLAQEPIAAASFKSSRSSASTSCKR